MKLVPALDRFGPVQSAAEVRVARLLAQVDLGEAATCFYSVHMPRHEYKRMTEIDFLVVLKGLVLVLEVKGGRISRRDGLWTFTDRFGDVHEKREGPFQQARTAMFALQSSLHGRVRGLSSQFGAVVITPDQSFDTDLEWDRAEHIGPGAMSVSGLTTALTNAARFFRRGTQVVARHTADYDAILHVVRPDFDRVPPLSLLTTTFEADYVALAREQYDMLRGSEVNPRIFCTGGAGSGKTLLAVETARRAAATGARVLLTCRSPGVIELMQRSLGESDVLCQPWTATGGVEPYDLLVVDEAQDLMSIDECLHMDQLVVGGLRAGRWRMFSDPNNQAHVGGDFDVEVCEELKGHASLYALPYNCRNTSSVVQQTQLMTGADIGVARAGHGPPVDYDNPASDAETAALVDARLKRLRQQDIDPSQVVLVTLRDSVEDSSVTLTRAFQRAQVVSAGPGNVPTAGVARVVTVRDFKGLEAPHVMVVDVDDLESPTAMSRLYVAMTRPRISLWLAVGARAWHQLRDIERARA